MGNIQSVLGRSLKESEDAPKCYYEILGVDSAATMEDIKRAYRKKALACHPDRNHTNKGREATDEFITLRQAYDILSDPDDRALYDMNRRKAVEISTSTDHHHDDDEEFGENHLDKYFSVSCYRGYDDSPCGFFAVYRILFESIESCEPSSSSSHEITSFGSMNTPYKPSIAAFYTKWAHFSTERVFGCELPRFVFSLERDKRRTLMHELQKTLERKRRLYNNKVRSLANFIKKKDPRYKRWMEQWRQCENKSTDLTTPSYSDVELDALLQRIAPVEENLECSDNEIRELYCAVCKKAFKSQNQWFNHERSSRHRLAMQRLGLDASNDAPQFDHPLDENEEFVHSKECCKACGLCFESRNQLFRHLRLEGHES